MRPGDYINLQDYEQLYGKEEPKARSWSWLVVLSYIFCLILAAWITQGCDGQAAEATHESVMNSQAMKEQLPPEGRVNSLLLSQPIGTTWIEQSGNDGLGRQMKPIRRFTIAGDLTRRK